eukprot:1981491-Prymnesium_polylepis.1
MSVTDGATCSCGTEGAPPRLAQPASPSNLSSAPWARLVPWPRASTSRPLTERRTGAPAAAGASRAQ